MSALSKEGTHAEVGQWRSQDLTPAGESLWNTGLERSLVFSTMLTLAFLLTDNILLVWGR